MPERGIDDRGPERDENGPEDGYGLEEQLRRALEQERHRLAARRFFDAAPLYRVQFEADGTVSLRQKSYDYWPARPPSSATRWRVLSTHRDLDEAERRLRLITSLPVHYDGRGRLTQMPAME
jgi:hypothetical protein